MRGTNSLVLFKRALKYGSTAIIGGAVAASDGPEIVQAMARGYFDDQNTSKVHNAANIGNNPISPSNRFTLNHK